MDIEKAFDGSIYAVDVDKLYEQVGETIHHLKVYNCEFDTLDGSEWQFGLITKPFCLFSDFERIALLDDENKMLNVE